MFNKSGSGPTRQDKTAEPMAQERKSRGATSAGGQGANAPSNDISEDPSSSQAVANLNSSANTGTRRGDAAAEKSIAATPVPPPAA